MSGSLRDSTHSDPALERKKSLQIDNVAMPDHRASLQRPQRPGDFAMSELPNLRTGQPRNEQGFLRPIEGLEIPFGVVEGERPGPCLLVTAGVHGSEYCSIEAALRLMKRSPRGLAGTILVLPIL